MPLVASVPLAGRVLLAGCQVAGALLAGALLAGALLAGCAAQDTAEKGTDMTESWRDAKARAQAMEQEIAAAIPEEWIAEIDQQRDGTLLSCGAATHSWLGATTVTLTEGADTEAAVWAVEARYRGTSWSISTRHNAVTQIEVQLRAPDTNESYLIAEDRPGSVRIASSSRCFTLPPGAYPGGNY